MAASLAAGLYGIENRLDLPAPVTGNAYADETLSLIPTSLGAAVACLQNNQAARAFLGNTFVDHYVMTRNYEVRRYEKAVTDWELQRYFEII